MSAALITATLLGIVGLAYTTVLGFTTVSSADIVGHTSYGVFSTLLTLLAHSMTMFYMIGKGKAVREAVTEGGLSPELYRTVAIARRPVFGMATLAMVLTMTAAILGAGVDTGGMPSGVHATLALGAIAANLLALRTEIIAMVSSARVVAEVDQLLLARAPRDA